MHIIQQVIFVLVAAAAIYFFTKQVIRIRKNILLGRDEDLSDNKEQRWKNMFIFALGQKKMFTNPLVAFLHLIVYIGFIIINIEMLEIVLDGLLGQHRLFAPFLGDCYTWLINSFEILAFLVLAACVVFLFRRHVIKVNRFTKPELEGAPTRDAAIILFTEIVLMSLFLFMNAADRLLQDAGVEHYTSTAPFLISSHIASWLNGTSPNALMLMERAAWWLHIIGIFAFLNYLPFSKHLHIVMAFPNSFYASLRPVGQMENMPIVQKEVVLMLQPERANEFPETDPNAPIKFGAKDVQDLSWKNLMDAYSCSECGRCTAACPANQTGKKLSPRKVMMDTRDRLEEVGLLLEKNAEVPVEGNLLDRISVEELRACTTCNACVQACPLNISPLDIILQLRRSLVMEDSNVPNEWAMMFGNLENNQGPWKFSNEDRANWRNA